jgi:cephalosporin hydroxylase
MLAYAFLGKKRTLIRHNELDIKITQNLWPTLRGLRNPELSGELKKRVCARAAGLYFLCRKYMPEVVVETGVKYGRSSSFILQALEDNGKGRLYSIDLPNAEYSGKDEVHSDELESGLSTGFLVSHRLGSNWDLRIGDAKSELPSLLDSVGMIDFFYHDSMHTYEHMTFEMNLAWSHLRKGGVLTVDDPDWNDAFRDFAAKVERPLDMLRGVGIIEKL